MIRNWHGALIALLILAVASTMTDPAGARDKGEKKEKKAKKVVLTAPHHDEGQRKTVIVHRGFPLHRTWPTVIVRRPVSPAAPQSYLPPINFSPVNYRRAPLQVIWQDSERIWAGDDWVETTLNVKSWGERLILSIQGQAQLAFAEIVFDNGEARVVDFADRNVRSGRYLLLDLDGPGQSRRDGRDRWGREVRGNSGGARRIEYVRVVARARTEEATLALLLER